MSSFYLHIPFCEHKCVYCDFYSLAPANTPLEQQSLVDRFIAALSLEIRKRSDEQRWNEPVETIFFGGGTPSLLTPVQIERIMNLLSSKFSLQHDAEITLETNPGTVDKEKLKAYRAIGINRLSIGIQSFFDDDLQFLTRIHTAAEAKQCVRDAYKAGFDNVSLDLIFSLPTQTLSRWQSNLEQAIELQPTHLSCYSLIIEPETPLFTLVQTKQVTPLPPEQDAELYENTMHFLTNHNFEQYEVSNFAFTSEKTSQFKCRHNINYWNHSHYLGFGPSAHSFWNKERWWNSSDLQSYIRSLESGPFPLAGQEHLTNEHLQEEAIFLGLRSEGIDLKKFKERFSRNLLDEHRQIIQDLLDRHLATIQENCLRLTSRGYSLCDEIGRKLL